MRVCKTLKDDEIEADRLNNRVEVAAVIVDDTVTSGDLECVVEWVSTAEME